MACAEAESSATAQIVSVSTTYFFQYDRAGRKPALIASVSEQNQRL